jgi:hypothetical protein
MVLHPQPLILAAYGFWFGAYRVHHAPNPQSGDRKVDRFPIGKDRLSTMLILGRPGRTGKLHAYIFANVLDVDEHGKVTNRKHAEKRATDYLRSYCDRSFRVDPPFEDWEVALH